MSKSSIIVGMSGGVDSSVTALLLKQQGYQVTGVFMKNWEQDDNTPECTIQEDFIDAARVCDHLQIPLLSVNFVKEYWQRVFTYFLHEYQQGRTPNPDILCNREIKFKAFLEYAQQQGAEKIATGHYARLRQQNGKTELLTALDTDKDQSYFLHAVHEKALSQTLFPIGALEKGQVRALAKQNGLVTSDKKDSTGLCFIGERHFKTFLARFLPAQPGDIRCDRGVYLGQHQGLMFYTLGQRKGLGIGGQQHSLEQPWYVIDKDLTNNVLIVGQGGQHPHLFVRRLITEKVHWISGSPPALEDMAALTAKIRYRQFAQPCRIEALGDGCYCVSFDDPQRAATPGQFVVFYQQTLCLGGGVIRDLVRESSPNELIP